MKTKTRNVSDVDWEENMDDHGETETKLNFKGSHLNVLSLVTIVLIVLLWIVAAM